jgi:Flp pilus assembly protein protease CpaA
LTKQKLKPLIPYAGLPVICVALLLIRGIDGESNALLRFEALAVFGYAASVYDIKDKRIPNALVLIMLGAWVVITIPYLFCDTANAIAALASSVAGFALAVILFLLVYFASRKGLGGGDVKFMAAAGLYLGIQNTLPAILYGAVLSAVTGIILILAKKMGRKDAIPFAPFLYVGILLTIFFR